MSARDRLASVGFVQDSVSALEKALGRRATNLERRMEATEGQVRKLERDVRREFKSVHARMDVMQNEINTVRKHLDRLMEQVAASFQELNRSVHVLKEVTERGDEAIVRGLKASEKTSREGLQRVSSGVAIVDVLKASSEAQEMAIAIEDSLADVDSRRSNAKAAVIEKRQAYDGAVRDAYAGLEEQVQLVAKHVINIQEHLRRVLDRLNIDENEINRLSAAVRGVQQKITRNRTQRIKEAFEAIDYTKLGDFQEWYASARSLLSDKSLLTIEGSAEEDGSEPGVVAFGLPTIAVLGNELDGTETLGVYCLDASSPSASEQPLPRPEYATLAQTIRKACMRLDPDEGIPLDAAAMAKIRDGVRSLAAKGMLQEVHAELMLEHLDAYPLSWMDS